MFGMTKIKAQPYDGLEVARSIFLPISSLIFSELILDLFSM